MRCYLGKYGFCNRFIHVYLRVFNGIEAFAVSSTFATINCVFNFVFSNRKKP